MFAQHIVWGTHRLQMEWGSQGLVAWAPIPLPCLVWSHQSTVIALCCPGWEERCKAKGWKHRWAVFQGRQRLWREQLLQECTSHEFSCVHCTHSSLLLSLRGQVWFTAQRWWPLEQELLLWPSLTHIKPIKSWSSMVPRHFWGLKGSRALAPEMWPMGLQMHIACSGKQCFYAPIKLWREIFAVLSWLTLIVSSKLQNPVMILRRITSAYPWQDSSGTRSSMKFLKNTWWEMRRSKQRSCLLYLERNQCPCYGLKVSFKFMQRNLKPQGNHVGRWSLRRDIGS